MTAAITVSAGSEADQIARVLQAHNEVLRAGRDVIAAAIDAGHALLTLREQHIETGSWRAWVDEHLPFSYATAHLYMRCAKHQDVIRENGWTGIAETREGLSTLVAPDHKAKGKGKPQWMKDVAREMNDDGVPRAHIARELGVSQSAVRCWVDPEWEKESRKRVDAINKRRIRAERILREQEHARAISSAVKKAGAALAEAYAMAERMQDVIAQAQRETDDAEAKHALSEAGVYHRRMRDHIVRALGVA